MKLEQLLNLLEANIYTNNVSLDKDIEFVFSCDLMSDVLMIAREADGVDKKNVILTTGLATNQSLRTAEMLDVEVICLVRGKKPSANMITLANESNITLVGTDYSTFKSNGLLFQEGLSGIERYVSKL